MIRQAARTMAGAIALRRAAAFIAPLCLALLAGCSDAPGDAAAEMPPPSPLLYEIASADGTVEGWMFGTIHALPDETDWRTPAIGKAIDTADILVVEVGDLDGGGAGPSVFESLAQSPGQPPLAERLPAELHLPLAALLDRGDLSDGSFSDIETWAAALRLARIDAAGDPANGVDRALIAEFSGKRPMRELEGLRGQLAIFDALPEPQQRAMLAAVVRESEAVRKNPARLLRAWIAGDAASIEASTREGILADPALHEALLAGRNRRWAAVIAPMLAEAPRPLIAVGTAHLVGPEGLAALLAAQGYTIRPVPTAAASAP